MALTSGEAITQLTDRASAKRRSAAKRLSELADETAGPALLHALQREIGDRRTWETRYEMIMVLGACGYRPAVGFLAELAQQPTDATALHLALGDSIVRLRSPQEGAAAPLEWCLDRGDPSLVDGALRAVGAQVSPRVSVRHRLTLTPCLRLGVSTTSSPRPSREVAEKTSLS